MLAIDGYELQGVGTAGALLPRQTTPVLHIGALRTYFCTFTREASNTHIQWLLFNTEKSPDRSEPDPTSHQVTFRTWFAVLLRTDRSRKYDWLEAVLTFRR